MFLAFIKRKFSLLQKTKAVFFNNNYWIKNISFDHCQLILPKTLNYYSNKINSRPISSLPEKTIYVIPPKHYLLLNFPKNSEEAKQRLKIIQKLIKKHQDYIEKVWLLGNSWLTLDDGISKSEGDLQFINFERSIWPGYSNFYNFKKQEFRMQEIRPKAIIWLIKR